MSTNVLTTGVTGGIGKASAKETKLITKDNKFAQIILAQLFQTDNTIA